MVDNEQRSIGIVMNGVTGRMGYHQHLLRSILAIRAQGGLRLKDGTALYPEPVLVGRDEAKLAAIAKEHGLDRWTTDLDKALAAPDAEIYFDAQVTSARAAAIRKAIAAGLHVYTEKPLAEDTASAMELARLARDAGVKAGVVQDKLFLPGFLKLKRLVDSGFSAEFSLYAANSATGCSKVTGRKPSDRPGTTVPRMAAESSSTCSATGDMCWRKSSARFTQSSVLAPRISWNGWTSWVWAMRARPTTLYTESSNSTAGSSPRSTRPGPPGCSGTSWWNSRSTAPKAARWPGYAGAASSTVRRPRSRRGTPTCQLSTTSAPNGRKSRTTRSSTTDSRRSGSCSSVMSWMTKSSRGISSPEPEASNSPNLASAHGVPAVESISSD